jgi:hypothetical protein
MAWTNPSDRTTGDVITAAQWNSFLGTTGDMSMTAAAKVTTNGDMVYATAANTLTRLGIGSAGQTLQVSGGVPTWATAGGATLKYKTATQVFTTTTTFADVTADGSPATMSFVIAANEVWVAEYWIPLATDGTGGVKFQLTGPAAPTGVNVTGMVTPVGDVTTGSNMLSTPFQAATAFSAAFVSRNSVTAGTTVDAIRGNIVAVPGLVHIRARIINGANAGTVTLQAAQNSSNATTTLGIGTVMRAEKVA